MVRSHMSCAVWGYSSILLDFLAFLHVKENCNVSGILLYTYVYMGAGKVLIKL